MLGEHRYEVGIEWTGDRGTGTSGYREYGRRHVVRASLKVHEIEGSADRAFHGDRDRWNPEELLLSALAQCHMLSYLHVATRRGLVVRGYTDAAIGVMRENGRGGGAFTEAVLHPVVVIDDADQRELALEIHAEAAEKCFIAASVAFAVRHEPEVRVVAA